jgi:hypothetical protein
MESMINTNYRNSISLSSNARIGGNTTTWFQQAFVSKNEGVRNEKYQGLRV